jgi:ABC-type lipoprotein release transport system permease subunit
MVPVSYSYRNLIVRWKTTLMTASGFMLVVMALVVMLAFVNGVRTVCTQSGQPENIIVMKEGNVDEVLSQIDQRTASQAELTPGVSRAGDGRLFSSRELFMAVTQWDAKARDYFQIQVRGVYPVAMTVHNQVRLLEGRMFNRNAREVLVGRGIARQRDVKLGDKLPLGDQVWDVVGIFEAGGSAFESEVWGDLDQLASVFRREGIYSSVVLRTDSAAAAEAAVAHLQANRSISVEARTEMDYYDEQAEQTEAIMTGALVISVFMGIGAVFGVTNTMFAAIGERIKDIAVMRLLGFTRPQILISFLLETLLIAAVGTLLGLFLGYCVNGLTLSTALGGKSVAFAFEVDTPIVLIGIGFALVMGVIGGLTPAMSAMSVDPLETMR